MYDQYADDIYRFVLVHVRDVQVAEDLTADTFLKAWKNIHRFDFKHSRAWLYKIAQNTMTDYWRRRKPLPLDETVEIADDKPDHSETMDTMFDKARVHKALASLPQETKSVIILRFMHGYSVRQTAEALSLTEANVRVIQYRGLKKMKGSLS